MPERAECWREAKRWKVLEVTRVLTPSLQAEETRGGQLEAALESCTGDQLPLNPGCTGPQGPCSSQHLVGKVEKPKSQWEKSLVLSKVGCMGSTTLICAWKEEKRRDLGLTVGQHRARSTATPPKVLTASPKCSLVLWHYSRRKIPLEI